MSYLNKKRRKNINITNKPQQWRSFSVDDIKISKPNKINNPVIDGYDQIKNTHKQTICACMCECAVSFSQLSEPGAQPRRCAAQSASPRAERWCTPGTRDARATSFS